MYNTLIGDLLFLLIGTLTGEVDDVFITGLPVNYEITFLRILFLSVFFFKTILYII